MLGPNKRPQRVHPVGGAGGDPQRASYGPLGSGSASPQAGHYPPSTPTMLREAHAQHPLTAHHAAAKPAAAATKSSLVRSIKSRIGWKSVLAVCLLLLVAFVVSRRSESRPKPLARKPLKSWATPPPHVHREPGAEEVTASEEAAHAAEDDAAPSISPYSAVHEHPAAFTFEHEAVEARRPPNFALNGEQPAYNDEKLTPLFDRPHIAALETPGLVTSFLSPNGRLKLSVLMSEDGRLGYMLDVAKPGTQKAGVGSAVYVPYLSPSFLELNANFQSCRFNTENAFGAEVAWQLEVGESWWRPVPGNERRHFHDSYQQAKVWCVGKQCVGCAFVWEYRLYDHALAVRAVVDGKSIDGLTVTAQTDPEAEYARLDYGMEVRWPEHTTTTCWAQNEENPYVERTCSDISEPVMTPFTAILNPLAAASLPEGAKAPVLPYKYLSILQADGPAFMRSMGQTSADSPNTLNIITKGELPVHALQHQLGVVEHPVLGWSTPTSWNVLLVGDSPQDLVHHNYLVYLLCPPPSDKFPMTLDSRWVGHGKSLRVRGHSNLKADQLVDFAARYNYQLIHFDAGWYGNEYNKSSDPRDVHPDFKIDLQMASVVQYAQQRGIGVTVYVNEMALKDTQELIDIYARWGLFGIKFGFVDVSSPRAMRVLHQRLLAYQHTGMAVNVHDYYRPRGLSRTWPHLVTQEGVRGEERKPDATHHTILPFVRYLQGAADYTPRYLKGLLRCTRAHQLALPLVLFSPIQSLFWAEPGQAIIDAVSLYMPELIVWQLMPTTWDDTRVLGGKVGEFASVARRAGEEWFVGTITNTSARIVPLNLSSLFDHSFDGGSHPLPLVEQPLSNKLGWMVHMYEDEPTYEADPLDDTTNNNRKVKLRQSFILPAKWSTAVHHRSKGRAQLQAANFPDDPLPNHVAHLAEYRRRVLQASERQLHNMYVKETGEATPKPKVLDSPIIKLKLAPSGGNVLYITPILPEAAPAA